MFNQKITSHQNTFMLILISFALQTMMMPNIFREVDGPTGWISIIISAIILYLLIKPINKVMKKHEDDSIILIYEKMFPKYTSKIVGLYYIFLFMITNSILMKDFAEQIKLLMLFNTPISVIIIIILLTGSYAAKKGIQTIGQISYLTVIIALIPYLLLIIFSLYYSDYTNIFPLYPVDIEGVIKAVPNTLYGFFGISIMLFSNKNVTMKEKNTILNKRFIIISCLLYVICYLLIIIKFGLEEASKLVWPFLSVMKFVNIPGFFFESTEIVGLSFQIIITFTCICILMYFTNHAMQETFQTRESGYFNFIQIPILYIIASALPGMYMLHPYIQLPSYVLSGLNLLIPLIVIFADGKKQSKMKG